jgi:hypothetical protein
VHEVTPPLVWHLKNTYPFNPPPKELLSDSDLKAHLGEQKYKETILSRIEKKRRWGFALSKDDEKFLLEYPETEHS